MVLQTYMATDKDKRSNIAIWRIDKSLEAFSGKTSEQVITAIKEARTNRPLSELTLTADTYGGKKVKVFHAQRFSEGWSSFLGALIGTGITQEKIKDVFHSVSKDFILFIYDDENIFAITSGAGYHIIQSFIDERFPFEVAKRML